MTANEYVTAKQIVDELGIKSHQSRRWAYKQIKNMLKAKYGPRWKEFLYTDEKDKKYVAKIPKDFAETIKENLMKMRTVRKKQILYDGDERKIVEIVVNRW